MVLYFLFWFFSLGLIFIGSLEIMASEYIVGTGFFGIFVLVAYSIHKGSYRWAWVLGLIAAGVLINGFGNALSYVRDNGEVVDNLLIPYGAIMAVMGAVFGFYLSIFAVGRKLYRLVKYLKLKF